MGTNAQQKGEVGRCLVVLITGEGHVRGQLLEYWCGGWPVTEGPGGDARARAFADATAAAAAFAVWLLLLLLLLAPHFVFPCPHTNGPRLHTALAQMAAPTLAWPAATRSQGATAQMPPHLSRRAPVACAT